MPRGASRASTATVAVPAGSAARRSSVHTPVAAKVTHRSHAPDTRALSNRACRSERHRACSVAVVEQDLHVAPDGTGLIKGGVVVLSTVGCGIKRRQAVGDIGDCRGNAEMLVPLVLTVDRRIAKAGNIAVRIRGAQLYASGSERLIDAAHRAAIVVVDARTDRAACPVERRRPAARRRARRPAE